MFFFRRRSNLRCEFKLVGLAANPLGLRRAWRKKREGFEPLFASLKKLVLFLKSFGSRGDANEFLAVDKGVAWITGERAERQACAAIVTVANGLEVRRGHDPSPLGGRRRNRGSAGGERAEDIDFGTGGEPPGNVHADKENNEADGAAQRVY